MINKDNLKALLERLKFTQKNDIFSKYFPEIDLGSSHMKFGIRS